MPTDTTPCSAAAAAAAAARRQWQLYALLAALRVLGSVFFLGMVHPDEFFQSQEVMARHVLPSTSPLRRELFVPWEYQLPTPNRSVIFPVLVAGAPYKLLELLGVTPSGLLLLVLPRLLLCVSSFVIDAVLYAIIGKLADRDAPQSQRTALLLLASSWPTLVFLTRPFSNTFETLVLAFCFAVLFLFNPHRRVIGLHMQTLLLGALLALGFFTRFTFPVFFFPLGLELVRQQDVLLLEVHQKKADDAPSALQRLLSAASVAAQGFVAFALCSTFFIALDTFYFRPEVFQLGSPLELIRQVVVAPLNNLQYNLQYDNLELHGVHPRLTHLTVTMPMLFGPVFLVFLVRALRFPDHDVLANLCVLFPLFCLSLAPHQEPRFLLPTLVPLHLFTALRSKPGHGVTGFLLGSRLGLTLWTVFNLALTLFFGVLHQGGLVPLLLSLSTSTSSWPSLCSFHGDVALLGSVPLVFAKTYMPPRFLLAGLPITSSFRVLDLAGSSVDDLSALINPMNTAASTPERVEAAFLVLPASVDVDDVIPETSTVVSVTSKVGRCWPHLSTEDLALDKPLSLDMYLLQLSQTSDVAI